VGDPGLSEIELSDEALVVRVAQQDVSAFALIYDRYVHPVYALAAHMLGRAEAEEIIQEVFLSLWSKADQFDIERGSFRAWFMTIARHRVWDELRRRSQQRLVDADEIDQLLAGVVDPAASVEEEVWLRERSRVVLEALDSLPAEQRRALILAYFGGFSQSAIAQHLDWPLGTVKKRIRLGLQKLRMFVERPGLAVEVKSERHTPAQSGRK